MENPDFNNPKYNTKAGIYSEGCGLENVLMSWGHDDYMYLVNSLIPFYSLSTIIINYDYMIHKTIIIWLNRWPRRMEAPYHPRDYSSSDTIPFIVSTIKLLTN